MNLSLLTPKLCSQTCNRNDTHRGIHVDDMEYFAEERREYVRHPTDVMMRRDDRWNREEDFEEHPPEAHFEPPFKTTGESHHVNTLHGIDDHSQFDSHDYFGSSMVNLGKDKKTGLTTLVVGAPGALDTSGVLYFMNVDEDGHVDSYTYLTNEDFHARVGAVNDHWGANTALGWSIENIGDLDGMCA